MADVMPQHGICQGGPGRFRGWQAQPCLGRGDHLVAGQAGEPLYHVDSPRRARRKKRDADGCTDGEPWETYIAFATNDPDIDVEAYCRRWGIEIGYRQLESMRITIRSRHHGARVMCMSMIIMLFNSWILADALMRLDCKAQGTRTMIRLYSMPTIV